MNSTPVYLRAGEAFLYNRRNPCRPVVWGGRFFRSCQFIADVWGVDVRTVKISLRGNGRWPPRAFRGMPIRYATLEEILDELPGAYVCDEGGTL